MMKNNSTSNALLFLFFIFYSAYLPAVDLFPDDGMQPAYSGIFQVQTGDITLTLTLNQNQNNSITGTLKSSNGSSFTLEGMVSDGIASGICSGNEGALFFEAYLDGNDITLSLIEPDQFNMPDYDRAEYLVLSRGNQLQQAQPQYQTQPSPEEEMAAVQPEKQTFNQQLLPGTKPGSEVVKDDMNGYSFNKPDGWVHQQGDGQILLGSNTIAGLISVFPHKVGTVQELQGLMYQGIQEEGVFLSISGGLEQQTGQMITGTYSGSVQGEQAKGYGIGLLSPHGGGIFILAVSTPDKLGQEIIVAANSIAEHTSFQKQTAGSDDLVRHFAGEWAWTNGYRTEWMTFFPDGSYSDQSEASYSGNFSDGSGSWGAVGQDSNRGRWSVRGNRDAGVITVVNPEGSQSNYEYKVFIERGEKYYREYLFNGYHYQKQKNF